MFFENTLTHDQIKYTVDLLKTYAYLPIHIKKELSNKINKY